MKTYYHVTRLNKLNSIMTHGLIPFIGPLSQSCNEQSARIYLFPDLQSMEEALASWMGIELEREYGKKTEFCSLKVTLPDDFPIVKGDVPYEVYSYDVIAPQYISYLKDE